jgi:hypothetical protein
MTPSWFATAEQNNLIANITAAAAPVLQGLGAFGMRAHHRARGVIKAPWSILAAFAAAAMWLVALLAGLAGQAAGPGGLVLGLLIMLPAAVAAPVLQIASLLGFANAERPAA